MGRVFSLLLFSTLLYSSTGLFAQATTTDSSFILAASANARQFYFQTIKAQSNLYNGAYYLEYNQREDEHPYFFSDDWAMGSITYDGDDYEEVPLMYDISQQKIITEHLSTASKIALVTQRVQRFTIFNHTFVWLEREANMHTTIVAGFYDLLYDGKIKAMGRYQKQLQERIVSGNLHAEFETHDHYYIFRNNNFFPVKSKASVIEVLGDQKAQVKQFIKKNKISFRKNREHALARVGEFYDSLTN